MDGLPESTRRQLLSDVAELKRPIDAMSHSMGGAARALNGILSTLWGVAPGIVMSPLIASLPKTFAYTCAASWRGVAALGRRLDPDFAIEAVMVGRGAAADGRALPFVGGGEFGRLVTERMIYPPVLAATYGPPYAVARYIMGK